MRYNLPDGAVIKAENAAKPAVQASKFLADYIANLEPVDSCFDYGCGKLRYAESILRSTNSVTVVDSEIQISRTQILQDKMTNIRSLARQFNSLTAVNTMEFSADDEDFERGFCINVLSAIPFQAARRWVLALIRQRLRPGGSCLFVVQYRNSDFERMSKLSNARPWLDGFVVNSLRGCSFYGLITPQQLTNLVIKAGFRVLDRRLDEGRVYLMARSPAKPSIKVAVTSEAGFAIRRV